MNALQWKAYQLPAQIDEALAQAVDENGEIVSEQALARFESLLVEKQILATDLALFAKECETVALAHLDQVIDELKAKRARIAKAQEAAEKALAKIVPAGEKLETDFVKISWRKSKAVEVDIAPELLPEQFQTVKITVAPDKKAIKEAIEAGHAVPGCQLVEKQNLQIK